MKTFVIFNPKESEKVWNFKVKKNEQTRILYASILKKPSRHEINVELAGEGAEAEIFGLYLLSGKAQLELNTHQLHTAPKTRSRLLVKGCLNDNGVADYRGLITVAKRAAGTDAYQENRNLLFGDYTRADSKPFLEILADEVKCSHGASTAPLSDESIYYLNSRGINEPEAKRVLAKGFLRPVEEVFAEHIGGELSIKIEDYLNAAN